MEKNKRTFPPIENSHNSGRKHQIRMDNLRPKNSGINTKSQQLLQRMFHNNSSSIHDNVKLLNPETNNMVSDHLITSNTLNGTKKIY